MPADGNPPGIEALYVGLIIHPFHNVVTFIESDWKSILRRQMIINAYHGAADRADDEPAPGIIIGRAALNEAAAVNVDKHR